MTLHTTASPSLPVLSTQSLALASNSCPNSKRRSTASFANALGERSAYTPTSVGLVAPDVKTAAGSAVNWLISHDHPTRGNSLPFTSCITPTCRSPTSNATPLQLATLRGGAPTFIFLVRPVANHATAPHKPTVFGRSRSIANAALHFTPKLTKCP